MNLSSAEQWAVAVQFPGTRSTSSREHVVEDTDRIISPGYTLLIETTPLCCHHVVSLGHVR